MSSTSITVLHDRVSASPLAWIHRAEARSIARELRQAGHSVRLLPFREDAVATLRQSVLLLRLSDPVMRTAARALRRASVRYFGPRIETMERCYDKYEAVRMASAAGFDTPPTALANDAGVIPPPAVIKP